MKKVKLLVLEHEIGSEGLDINLALIFEELGVGGKAYEVTAKYQNTLIEMANELLTVLQDGVKKYKEEEE